MMMIQITTIIVGFFLGMKISDDFFPVNKRKQSI